MKRMICAACVLMMAFIPAPVQAEGGEKAAVIILDAAGCPAEAAEEPWLMQPCMNAEHYYFRPMENGEPDTLVSYALNSRFMADKAAMKWKPWLNHYEKRIGAKKAAVYLRTARRGNGQNVRRMSLSPRDTAK